MLNSSMQAMPSAGKSAFVLGDGGLLGAAEVGMLQALTERRVQADLVLGSSFGAINGAALTTPSDGSAATSSC